MSEEIRERLDELILDLTYKMSTHEPGSKEFESSAEAVETLYKLAQTDFRNDCEYEEKLFQRELEEKKEETRKAEARKDRIIKCAIAGVEVALPLWFYNKWTKWGFKFETDHIFSSTTFRTFFNKFKLKR